MGLFHRTVAEPGFGESKDIKISRDYMNRSGGTVAIGDVLQVDITGTDADSNDFDNTETGVFGNVIAPRAGLIAGNEPGHCVVVVDLYGGAGADNTKIKCRIFGPVDAFVIGASGSMAVGTALVATTAKNFDIVTATGERVFAFGGEAVATPTTRTLGKVFLDNGWFYCAGVASA